MFYLFIIINLCWNLTSVWNYKVLEFLGFLSTQKNDKESVFIYKQKNKTTLIGSYNHIY